MPPILVYNSAKKENMERYKTQITFKNLIWSVLVFGLAFLTLLPLKTGAQSNNTSSGLRVAPLRSELIISPGKSDIVSLKLKNVTSGRVIIRSAVVDFESKDDGSPSALPQDSKELSTSIKSFLTPEDGVELEADAEYEYKLPIAVPKGTSPGAYYGLVLFQAIPADQIDSGPGRVALTASIGHVVLLEVPGNIIEQLQVLSLKAARKSQPDISKAPIVRSGSLFSSAPNQIQIDIKNTGNGFVKPFGNVTITDWRDNQVSSVEINSTDPKGNVLPGNNRVFTSEVAEIKGIGRFTMLASIGHGNGNEVITVKSSFWILPLWFVAIIAVALALLIFGILRLAKKLRR